MARPSFPALVSHWTMEVGSPPREGGACVPWGVAFLPQGRALLPAGRGAGLRGRVRPVEEVR